MHGPAPARRPGTLRRAAGKRLQPASALAAATISSSDGITRNAAPASGVTQELYFRSALLPVLLRWLSNKPALLVHAAVFALWHLRMLTQMPVPVALVSLAVMFLAGTGWGWQAMRDHTVVWAMAQHSLFLMVMALFTFT